MIREGNLLRRVGLGLLGFTAVMLLFRHKNYLNLSLTGLLGGLILLFVFWSFISLSWSIDPSLTFRRLLVLAVFWLAAVALASSYPIEKLPYFALLSAGLFLLTGVVSEILLGTFEPWSPTYRFAGTLHPNVQGESCALLLLAAGALTLSQRKYRFFYVTVMIIACIALILTRSRTSFVGSLIVLFIMFLLSSPFSMRKTIIVLGIVLGTIVIAFVSVNFFEYDFSLFSSGIHLGRDIYNLDTLNGRLKIWNLCIQYVADRPVIGHGYEGFWNLVHIYQLSSLVGWGLPSAHSAYIDLLLNVGLVGLGIFLVMILVGLRESFRLWRDQGLAGHCFLVMLLVFYLFQGVLESRLSQLGYGTFLIFWGLSCLAFRKSGNSEDFG